MKRGRVASLVAAALVAGIVAGNAASGFAAAAPEAPATAGTGMGLRLGSTMRDSGGRLADVVAKLTDMTVEEVRAQRADGKSLADVAATKDVSAEKLVESALDVRKTVLDAKVTDGTISQDQADAALDRMKDRLTDRVTSTDASCDGTGDGAGNGGGRKGAGNGGGNGGGGKGAGNGGVCAAQ